MRLSQLHDFVSIVEAGNTAATSSPDLSIAPPPILYHFTDAAGTLGIIDKAELWATADVDQPVVEAIHKVADARGVPMARVALAWVLSRPVVTCPIVGATKPNHLQDAVAALDLKLTGDVITELEGRYTPQDNYWW